MRKLLLILIVFISCENKSSEPKIKKTVLGLYNVVEPKEESKNVYIFGENELYHITCNNIINGDYSTFKYFIKGKSIFTCLKGVMECEKKSNYDLNYTIKSIDTINNKQILLLTSNNTLFKLSKNLD